MAERDRAAIDVEPLGVGAGGFEPRRRYRGKGLVDLEQVDVIDRQAGLLQRAFGRVQRRVQHDHGIAAHHGHVVDPRHRLDTERFQALFVDDHHAGGAVADLAGACRGELAVLGDQLDAPDAREADVEADAFVNIVGIGRAVGARDLHRNDLVFEAAGLGGGNRALVAVIGILIQFVFGEAVFFRHHLCAGELAEHDVGVALLDSRALVVAETVLCGQRRSQTHRHPRHRLDARGDHDIHAA